MRTKLLDVWAHVEPRFGGVGPAAANLAAEVCSVSKWESRLVAICDGDEKERHGSIPATVDCVHALGPRPIGDLLLRRALQNAVGECDICHVHGLWLPHVLAARTLARRLKKIVVSSVHGMVSPYELRKKNKALKKAAYSLLFEKPSLAHSDCIRALSVREAEDCRRYGLKNPIAVVPTGVLPLQRLHPGILLDRFPELAGKSIVLYLGRVHYQKGIISLVKAWVQTSLTHPDAHLLIAGPDHPQTREQVDDIVSRNRLAGSVTFAGMLTGDMKLAALSAARYFCLPSYSEALSVALLEALSIGLPVIVTPSCNMDEIVPFGAGMVTSNAPDLMAETLSECLAFDDSRWMAMSQGAIRLARTRYDWAGVAKKMHSVYLWLLGGVKPDCVVD